MGNLLTVYKHYERMYPMYGEDLLMNLSCKSCNNLTKEDIQKVCKYAKFHKLGMRPTLYYHYLCSELL